LTSDPSPPVEMAVEASDASSSSSDSTKEEKSVSDFRALPEDHKRARFKAFIEDNREGDMGMFSLGGPGRATNYFQFPVPLAGTANGWERLVLPIIRSSFAESETVVFVTIQSRVISVYHFFLIIQVMDNTCLYCKADMIIQEASVLSVTQQRQGNLVTGMFRRFIINRAEETRGNVQKSGAQVD